MPKLEIRNQAKDSAAKEALKYVQPGMVLGLGTGSTVHYFINHLIKAFRQGLNIQVVATSIDSEKKALEGNLPLVAINHLKTIDLNIDGADEINVYKEMIKGGGGALLREKIVASMANKKIIIVDQKKYVTTLGKFPLAIEILPFAFEATLFHLTQKGFNARLRFNEDKTLYLTDNKNLIVDLFFQKPLLNPKTTDSILKDIPGVLETGLFFNLVNLLIIGQYDGTVLTL